MPRNTIIPSRLLPLSIASRYPACIVLTGIIASSFLSAAHHADPHHFRSWTGVSGNTMQRTTGFTNSDKPQSKYGLSQGNSSAFTNSRNQTSTFESDTYGRTSSNFGGTSQSQSLGVGIRGQRGFTNRMTVGELSEGEEWEMTTSKKDELPDSPITPVSALRMDQGESVVDLGSMAHLNGVRARDQAI